MEMQCRKMAKFIVIYGINNIGKTTQCRNIVNYLRKKGLKVRYLKTPNYNFKSGKEINNILRSKKQLISEKEFQLLYAINRLEQQKEVMKCLDNNINVIMEDYVGTSFAWGNVKGLTMNYLKKINKGLLKEDVAILLDGKRFPKREKIHIHEKDNILMNKVRKRHLELAKEFGWNIVNSNQSRGKVFGEIKKIID